VLLVRVVVVVAEALSFVMEYVTLVLVRVVLVSVLLVKVVVGGAFWKNILLVLLVRVTLEVSVSEAGPPVAVDVTLVPVVVVLVSVLLVRVSEALGPVADDVTLVLVSVVLLVGAILLVVALAVSVAARRLTMPGGPWPTRSAALAARPCWGPESACVGGMAASLAKPLAMGCSAPMERTLPMLMTDLARQWPFVFGDRSRAQSILRPAEAEATLRPRTVPTRWTLKM
jgi:hypothetical protein